MVAAGSKAPAAKKAREARKKETRITVKQIKLRPNIDEHDLETKVGHARRFLIDGDKVRVTIMFRGRDLRRPENGRKVLDRVIELLNDVASIESAPGDIVNRDMSMTLGPRKSGGPVRVAAAPPMAGPTA